MSDAAAISLEVQHIDQLLAAGRFQDAIDAARRLAAAAPAAADARFRLGLAHSAQGGHAEAERAFEQTLVHAPQSPPALAQLGLARQRQGRAAEAEEPLRQAVALAPGDAHHWHLLGSVLYDQRRLDEALEAYRRALQLAPASSLVWNDLAVAEQARGNTSRADEAFRRAIALAPGEGVLLANYSFFLCKSGQHDRAWQTLQPAVVRDVFSPDAWLALGNLFAAMQEHGLAVTASQRAWQLAPDHPRAGYELAAALESAGKPAAAEAILRESMSRCGQHPQGLSLLGEVLIRQCRIKEGLEIAQTALGKVPDPHRHSRLLLEQQYDEDISLQQLFLAHRQWNNTYAKPLARRAAQTVPAAAGRAPRIGIVSQEFGQSPAAFLVLPCLESLPRLDCQLYFYSDRTNDDEYTTRFRGSASKWRTIYGQSDEQVARLIERDQIDLLIDLMGHTGRRLLIFARQPAARQLTWLGYVGTTGMPAIDFLLADAFHVRTGEERWYAERVLRMPHSYACYGPPPAAPDVGELPALAAGQVTFGCFNNPPKYSPAIREAWVEILRRVPTSRLLLKFLGLDEPALAGQLRDWFAKRGIAEERIMLEGWSPHRELLAAYHRVDLALDTQPYSGGLTTCEALWMGVPVITFPGDTFAGRHSTSYLTTAGLPQFVAANVAGYVDLATHWAARLAELAVLRRNLRDQLRQSPLCNPAQFARDFLSVALASSST